MTWQDKRPTNWNMAVEIIQHLSEMRKEISLAIKEKNFELWLYKLYEIWITIKHRIEQDIDSEEEDCKPYRHVKTMDAALESLAKEYSQFRSTVAKASMEEKGKLFSMQYWPIFNKFIKTNEYLNALLWEYEFMWPVFEQFDTTDELDVDFGGSA